MAGRVSVGVNMMDSSAWLLVSAVFVETLPV